MREILFRAQTRRKGEKVWMNGKPVPSNWVFGGILPGKGDFSIIYSTDPLEKFPVYSDTVGQYAEKVDRFQRKIFEGDIIRTLRDNIGVVKFAQGAFVVSFVTMDYLNYLSVFSDDSIEIIGNIYDDPELLKKEENG